MDGFTCINTPKAYILYVVNLKNDYKKQCVFMNLNTAKHMKKNIQNHFDLQGSDVFVNKIMGFNDNEGYIHGLNGFKYSVSSIQENETYYKTNNIEPIYLKLHQ
jgi:hypothetical protein